MARTRQKHAETRHFHLDKRVDAIIDAGGGSGADDQLLDTDAMAAWLGVSVQWLNIGRHLGYGPPFKKINPRCVRYLRGDVLKWLAQRTHVRTAEYTERLRAPAKKAG